MRIVTSLVACLSLLSIASVARAADPASPVGDAAAASASPSVPAADAPTAQPKPKEEPRELRRAYVSFSPVHLVFPVVELTAEVRLHPRIGIAAIGGFGNVKASGLSIPIWEAGGQFVAYPVGDFDHGMQLGAEALYMGASAQKSEAGTTVTASAAGLSTGAFVGYKLATRVGFTFNLQAGVAYLTASGDAKATGSSATATASASTWAPLVNANVGWSF